MSCGGPPVVGDYHLGGSQCQGWTLISQGATGPVGGFGNPLFLPVFLFVSYRRSLRDKLVRPCQVEVQNRAEECGFRVLGYPDIRIPGYFGHRLIRTCRSKVLER